MKKYFTGALLLSALLAAGAPTRTSYQACLDRSASTVEMRACAKEELRYQDHLLNRYYKEAMKVLGPQQRKDLRNAQRAWIKYRDANCEVYYGLTGGTMDIVSGDDCLVTMTVERTEELKNIAGTI